LHRSTVNFSAIVAQLVDLYQPAMAERHHELAVAIEDQINVDADEPLLHRLVSNLLENELVHLPPGCRVAIRVRSRQGSVELVVEDNGPGFPPDIRRRAFERFVKGKDSPGHGLGLAFVDAIARAHGGSVNIANLPAGGAVVTLLLPAKVLQSVNLTTAG